METIIDTAQPTTFRLDIGSPALLGWTFQIGWNGWGCPYFEKDAADLLVKLINTAITYEEGKVTMTYDYTIDSYVVCTSDGDDDPIVVQGQRIMTTLGSKCVYPIGAREWCWLERGVHFT